MHSRAQQEIRAYANVLGEEVVARWTPLVWEAFLDYRKNAIHLSSIESDIVAAFVSGDTQEARGLAARHGLLNRRQDGALKANRERKELEDKLLSLGLTPSWD